MRVRLFRELLAINGEFKYLTLGLEFMEKETTYPSEKIRTTNSHLQSAQIETNRQFFDQFDEIVENAIDSDNFLREREKRITDPDDIYLEIKHREEARKAKWLSPLLVILSDWDFDDENRYDWEQADAEACCPKA
jgi:hypothetical protein